MKLGKRLLTCFLSLVLALTMVTGTAGAYEDNGAAAVSASEENLHPTGGRLGPEGMFLPDSEAEALDEALTNRPPEESESIRGTSPYTHSSNYYYNTLTSAEKSFYTSMDNVCRPILTSMTDYSDYVTYSGGTQSYVISKVSYGSLTRERAEEVFWAFRSANPQYYFLSNTWGYTSNGEVILQFVNNYGHSYRLYSERKAAQQMIDDLTNLWIPDALALGSEYEREMFLSDKICRYLTYDNPALSDKDLMRFDQSLISGVMRKTTVCAGYAMLTAYMFNAAGLDCVYVDSEAHAWNAVKLYGNWYQIDITWADDGTTLDMNWINKSYATFRAQDGGKSDHLYDPYWDHTPMPPCTSDTVIFPDEPDTVKINQANFADAAFRSYVSANFDTDHNDSLSEDEINAVSAISVSGLGITKLNGIEHFTSLVTLDCSGNGITSLDISKNVLLEELDCSGNYIKTLNTAANTQLRALYCSDNAINSLALEKNTHLTVLNARSNQLTALAVSANTALQKIDCDMNSINALDVSNQTALKELKLSGNKVQTLDLSKNTALQTLDCSANKLSSLDLSKNTDLNTLNCSGNQLCCLDLSKNTSLTSFACTGNEYNIGGVTDSFALSGLAGFDPTKATGWSGAVYDSQTKALTDISLEGVTYTYDCGNAFLAEFRLAVSAVKSLSVSATPTKTAYYTGDEFDVTGGQIRVTFEDGTVKTTDMTDAMISGYDGGKSGRQTITVTYGGKTATFTVNVTALAASKLELVSAPAKTGYYLGDAIDLTGGVIRVIYNSGRTEELPLTTDGVAVTGFDSSRTGTRSVRFTYLGKYVTVNMTVSIDPATANVVVNGAGYETLTEALKANNQGDLDISINKSITEKNLTVPKTVTSAVITTAPSAVLTLGTPTITANCDLVLDAAVAAERANAKTFTVKAAAEKTVTVNRIESVLPVTLSGAKTSYFRLCTSGTITVAAASNVNVDIAAGTTVKLDGGKFAPTMLSGNGRLDVYGASSVTLANAVKADITLNKYTKVSGKNTTINLQKLTLGTVTALTLAVKEPDGTLSNITGQTVITLSKQDPVNSLETRVVITNTANGKPLSAVQYGKDVRAEYLDALTLSGPAAPKNYSSFEKVFEAMTDTSASYTIRLNEDMSLAKLTLPRELGSLTIDGNSNTLTLIGVTTIAPQKYGLSLKDINIAAKDKNGASAALRLTLSSGSVTIDGLDFSGKTLTIAGGSANTLALGECSEIYSLTGFAKIVISGETVIGKTFTANNVSLGSSANLKLLSGAALKVNKDKAITASDGAKITLVKGFTPIDITAGTIAPNIRFVSDTTLEDQAIFKTKADLKGVYDLSDIAPDNGLAYDLLQSGSNAYLKAFAIDVNGEKFAFWNDAIASMTSRTTAYRITLLANIDIGAALKLPSASKCGSLTIDGGGHRLTFTGTSVSLALPLTFKDITVASLNKKTGAETAWNLRTNGRLTEQGTVVLTGCTKK